MKFKLGLFDLGSTLITYDNNSWMELGKAGCESAAGFLRENYGIDVSPEALSEKFHGTLGLMIESREINSSEIDLQKLTADILGEFGIDITDNLPGKFIDIYYKPIRDQITLVPDSESVLAELKTAGLKLGLVSNTIFPARYHREEMAQFGIYDYFDFTIFSSEEKICKPNKDIYRKALKLGGADAAETFFVGDRLIEDVGGPQSVRIKGILKYVESRDYSADIRPFGTIHHLTELKDIILK